MKVAAYQAPLLMAGSMEALPLIRSRVEWCEHESVSILCCPEASLGGLADDARNPASFAIAVPDLPSVLAPLASDTVTTIIGFTELAPGGVFYNSAAVYHRGAVTGVYRKLYPAIRHSVYQPGDQAPVFRCGALIFGIVICNDSNYLEPARLMAAQGAVALFVPTNNGMPTDRGGSELASRAQAVDIARAVENGVWVIRADVAGRCGERVSHGASGITDPDGKVIRSAQALTEDLLVAEIDPAPPSLRRGWDAGRNRAVAAAYAAHVAKHAALAEPATVAHPSGIPPKIVRKVMARRGRLHAFETLEPATTALVVIDLDAATVPAPDTCRPVLLAVNTLAAAVRRSGGIVAWVLSRMDRMPPHFAAILGPELAARYFDHGQLDGPGTRLAATLDAQETDLRAWKSGASALFPGRCDLKEQLDQRAIDTLLIAGAVTNICCESTARDAAELGYKVILVSDALSGHAHGLHEATLATFYRIFGDVRPSAEIITLLAGAENAE